MSQVQPEKESPIVKIGSLVPQMTVAIIVLSIAKQVLYYKNYSLPIKYYIGLSELGLLLADNTLFYLPVLLVWFYVLDFLRRKLNIYLPSKDTWATKILFTKRNNLFVYIIIGVLSMVFFILMHYLDKSDTHEEWLRRCIPELIILAVIVTLAELSFMKQKPSNIRFTMLLPFSFLAFFIYIINKTIKEIKKVDSGYYNNTRIYISDSLVHRSNDSTYFIGKTENYIFIYNRYKDETTIIPSASVSKMVLCTNHELMPEPVQKEAVVDTTGLEK